MARITYTATDRSGRTFTRSSDSMFYSHRSLTRGSWHLTLAAAAKAGDPVPAIPTAISGYVGVGYYADHPNAAAIDALIEAKNARAAKKAAPKKAAPKSAAAALAARQAESEAAHRAEVDRRAAARAANGWLVVGHIGSTVPEPGGGPLGHLCQCLSQHAGFTITHGAECPSAPPRPTGETSPPPSLF